MAPPNKRTRQLRLLFDAKRQAEANIRADAELVDEVPIEISEDEFDLEGIAFNQDLVQRRWEDLIKWNPDAEKSMRAAYTGDSRATKYRKLQQQQERHRAVAGCSKIDTYFQKSNPSAMYSTEL